MKRELGIARCGLACCLCSENDNCSGCNSGSCPDKDWCENRKCSIEKGLDNCYQCEEDCRKGLLKKIKPYGFTVFIKRYGLKELLDCLERNEKNGIIYHRSGINGDYDDFDNVEELIHFIKTGKRAELWDGYTREFEKIDGITMIRGEEKPEGVYHLVCEVIVRHADGQYLIMQRDFHKHFGGMWEATAGGSAVKGETPLQCGQRELFEETGIKADNLKEIGRVVNDGNMNIYVEYLCETDCDKDSIVLQKGETVDYRWISKEELVSMSSNELATFRIQKFIEELKNSWLISVIADIQ